MPRIIFSEYVEPELTAIWEFIALDNLDAADRFIEAVHGTFQELARMPGIGCARKFSHARLRNLRSFRVKDFQNHLIFYEPLPDGIGVFHILHGARDLERFFESE
ncbi:MAG: type II toxin-antitoxin system RelE/ParE family toxin [Methylacidiphilales bacterium]|nr:type II toxin-antitoxin system RelE/ParE family toxin [Candidatus Methylacidiphilales bacterium]